ncbi:thioredoxin-like protein [Aspergillus flavus]|uniref:Oxidoreductase n=1 Tax=Aspergillus flavus TaxID=5059 RepID=A0A3M7JH42_ASPFL|nr:thioredoxin-like protein [Aspergillus flavus]RMZ36994.1 oxidoreductase [Aspergillus flavus]
MRDMDTVNVASDRASAHVGGGVIAGHLQETLKSHGLFTSTGKAKSVGYVFWACGGGLNEFHHVTTQSEPTILYFWARWCSPCKSLAPKIKEFANQNQNVRFFKVDVEEQRSIANEALVAFVPTVIIYQQGEIVKKLQAPEPAILGDMIQML